MATIKERPILMSAPMVVATLNGSKTQTRRIVKAAPGMQCKWLTPELLHSSPEATTVGFTLGEFAVQFAHPKGGPLGAVICPYGAPGERLWVRETLFFSTCEDAWAYQADNEQVWVDRPDDVYTAPIMYGNKPAIPSIHMPREVSRILLEIVTVRVERLQDITEADAVAEGIEVLPGQYKGKPTYRDYSDPEFWNDSAVDSYATLWEKINGPDSWQANPWVWVITFQRV